MITDAQIAAIVNDINDPMALTETAVDVSEYRALFDEDALTANAEKWLDQHITVGTIEVKEYKTPKVTMSFTDLVQSFEKDFGYKGGDIIVKLEDGVLFQVYLSDPSTGSPLTSPRTEEIMIEDRKRDIEMMVMNGIDVAIRKELQNA